LPKDRIAQFPSRKRDEARVLVLQRETGEITHGRFKDLLAWLRPRDLLIVNDTRVIPARLVGRKSSGGKVEVLLCEPISPDGTPVPPVDHGGAFETLTWRCLVQSRGRLRDGLEVAFEPRGRGVLHRRADVGWFIRLEGVGDLRQFLKIVGEMPLPPYIRRAPTAADGRRYQTVFARKEGSIAAPTAGLHFSRAAMDRLKNAGVRWSSVTLQVGAGTFSPVRAARMEDHRIHSEYMEVDETCCCAWRKARQSGGRVIAVGTTTVRALESAMGEDGALRPYRGFTSLFILPGYRFRAVDGLITNFHLPRSTLLMLVMALAGKERIRQAYEEAIRRGYRFYSYGDAMLIH